jgi:hypothetical protein
VLIEYFFKVVLFIARQKYSFVVFPLNKSVSCITVGSDGTKDDLTMLVL